VSEAFGAARGLLDTAAADAAQRREDAERYARQREQEADLLVQKARRLLLAAEEKAAVIVATARQLALADDRVIDLDALGGSRDPAAPDQDGIPSRLDELLASAISHAVSDAFAPDTAV
jgi:hypothetical protein